MKPTVHFFDDVVTIRHQYGDPAQPLYACVFAQDHPRLGKSIAFTTSILSRAEDGSFETRNTIYVPIKRPAPPEQDFEHVGGWGTRCNWCGACEFSVHTRPHLHNAACPMVEAIPKRMKEENDAYVRACKAAELDPDALPVADGKELGGNVGSEGKTLH